MTRLIDADALKETITKFHQEQNDRLHNPFWDSIGLNALNRLIDYAPTVPLPDFKAGYTQAILDGKTNYSRPQEWIPVSERLPNEEDYRDCYGLPDGCVLWQTDNGDIGFGWYYHATECWSDLNDNLIETGKVIAWQPLPEPYKEGDAE